MTEFKPIVDQIKKEIEKVVINQSEVVEKLLIALICKGHVLLEGNPGVAKTLLTKAFAKSIDVKSITIPFTPDLLPSDIIGTMAWNGKSFDPQYGDLTKANFVLIDEINRAPPKVHSALLQAMQEGKIKLVGSDNPFELYKEYEDIYMVLATQNPIESEGVFDLPFAQLDRFMFKLKMIPLSKEGEIEVMEKFSKDRKDYSNFLENIIPIKKTVVQDMQESLSKVTVDGSMLEYAYKIIKAARGDSKEEIKKTKSISFGASPRTSIDLIMGAKAKALIQNRNKVESDDIEFLANDALRHRIVLDGFQLSSVNMEKEIEEILNEIKDKVES